MAKQVTLTDRQTSEIIYPITSTDSVYNKNNKSVDELISETNDKINSAIVAVYKYKGSVATTADLPLSGNVLGDVYNVESDGANYAWNSSLATGTLSNWDALGGTTALATVTNNGLMSSSDFSKLAGIAAGAQVNTVTSVAGRTGAVTLTKTDVGLGNVDNTSDANKPISTATQAALDLKVDKVTDKGLSTNDYTTAEKTKLAGLSNYTPPTYTAYTSGLYKITTNTLGHVSSATTVAKADITALGIPAQDTTYSAGTGLTLTGTTINHTDSITAGTTSSSSGTVAFGAAITVPYVTYNSTGHITAAGTRSITLPSSVVTTSVAGLMSPADKTKLDGITAGSTLVTVTPSILSGTKIADYTINGTAGVLYSPTSKIVLGATTDTSDTAQTNGNVYINSVDNTTVTSTHKIYGTGASTVATDASGNVIVNSTNTTYSAGTGLALSGTTINHSNSVTADTASGSSGAIAFGGTVTIPSVTYDAQGHITAKGSTSITLPANPNTDTLVTQTLSTTSSDYPVILSSATTTGTRTTLFGTKITANPSTGNVKATTFTGALAGNATTATTWATARSIGLSGVTATAQTLDGSADITIPITAIPASLISGTLSNSTTGNAATATTLQTARTIAISGGATGTATSFNGSANITIPVTSLDATKLTGTASINTTGSAAKLSTSAGSATAHMYISDGVPTASASTVGTTTQPMFMNDGVFTACTYTLGKSVPSDAVFTDTTYSEVTTTTDGLMLATDKAKLDGIATNANNYTHPSYTSYSSGLYKVTVDTLGHVSSATAVAKTDITGLGIPAQDTTYTVATTSADGLMSSTDKTKLDGINITSGTTDLTAGTSALTTGAIYLMYE